MRSDLKHRGSDGRDKMFPTRAHHIQCYSTAGKPTAVLEHLSDPGHRRFNEK